MYLRNLSNLYLCLLLLLLLFAQSLALQNSALPDGWCDKRYGSPTRTTGECICKYACEGFGCQSSQGFIWYAYSSCPQCKCTEKGTNDAKSGRKEPILPAARHSSHLIEPEDTLRDEKEEISTIWDYLEDNLNVIVAVFASLVMLFIVIIMITFQMSKTEEQGSTIIQKNLKQDNSKTD